MARSKIGPALIAFFATGIIWAFFQMPAYSSDMGSIAKATYKLYDGDSGMCSTTFLQNADDGAMFLTAAHCVDGGDNFNIREQVLDPKDLTTVLSERVYYVKAAKTIAKKDIAILQLRDKTVKIDAPQVDIATVEEANSLKIGDQLMAVGYPSAELLAITKGEYTGKVAIKALELDAPMYQTTVPVAGGNSGGALYAFFEGFGWKLIGTTTAKRRDNDIMTYFQTSETVHEALRGFVKLASAEEAAPMPAVSTHPGLRIDER